MASRKELLESIRPDMVLTKNFFLKAYGYDMTTPGFAEDVFTRLEILGCSRAKGYYACVVAEWSYQHEKDMKKVAAWYVKQNFNRKKVNEPRKQQEAEQRKAELLNRKKELLMQKSKLSTGN